MTGDGGMKPQDAPRIPAVAGAAPARARREITSTELFGDAREVHIRHADEVYTLRRTSKGKLILTK